MSTSLIQQSFTRGEVSPEVAARTDLAAYSSGLGVCENFIISPYGGAINRAGTQFITETLSNGVGRLVRFKFNAADAYVLEFTHYRIRIIRNGGLVVYPAGHANAGEPVTIVTAYAADQLADLNFTQSADVMHIVHPAHRPRRLLRFSHSDWSFSVTSFVPNIAAPTGATATAAAGGSATQTQTWRYQVTAVRDDGSRVLEESLPATSGSIDTKTDVLKATVTWGAVAGATYYNVYKDNAGAGIYGFIGRANTASFTDANIVPTKTDTPPTGTDPFVGEGNYPRSVCYFQQRLCYASTNNKPQTMWFSRTGVFTNFGYSFPLKDDDAITWTMASGEVNTIKHMLPLRSLMTFTDGAEWIIQGQASGFTAKTINGDPQTYNGISHLRPLVVNDTAIYAQERGRTITAFGYKLESDGFSGSDIGLLSPHILEEYGLADWDFQQIPYGIVWGAREDGELIGITYMPEQQVIGWHRHKTMNGKVLSVCTVPEGRQDALYLLVERRINGSTKRYIERMADRQLPKLLGEPAVGFGWFLDCALRIVGTNVSATTMRITGGTIWAHPEELTLTASAAVFAASDVGRIYAVSSLSGTLRLEVVSYTSSTVVRVRALGLVSEDLRGVATTYWAKTYKTVGGLGHLEGQDVVALCDGSVYRGLKVVGGSVTIPDYSAVILVGLPYESTIKTLEVSIPNQETLMDKRIAVKQLTVSFGDTRGGWVGKDSNSLYELRPRDVTDGYGTIQARSGKRTQLIESNFEGNGSVTIVQKDPLPMNILAVIPSVEIAGKR